MATFWIFIIFCLIVVGYGVMSFKNSQTQDVILVEAGPTQCANFMRSLEKMRVPTRTIKLPNGSYKKSTDFLRIRINGNCMHKRNICFGEEWLVEPINHSLGMKEQLKKSDVLLIYIKDKKLYKIRELSSFLEEDMMETIYYDGEEVKVSSLPHSYNSVVGIVRYNI